MSKDSIEPMFGLVHLGTSENHPMVKRHIFYLDRRMKLDNAADIGAEYCN